MDIIISNSSNIPLYEQVKEQIKNKIVSNELKTGELLPSIRSLAKDLRISVITTKNAYEELEREGYVETIPGKGTYVANKNKELIKGGATAKDRRINRHSCIYCKNKWHI